MVICPRRQRKVVAVKDLEFSFTAKTGIGKDVFLAILTLEGTDASIMSLAFRLLLSLYFYPKGGWGKREGEGRE